MKRHPEHMKISELCSHAGIPAATIWYYTRMGLLPRPVKYSRTTAYYTAVHLKRLEQVCILKQKGLSLAAIADIVKEESQTSHNGMKSAAIYESKRDIIMQAAVELFREKGYNSTTIRDIAVRAGIGKITFYQYFKDKRELFLKCADNVFYDIGKDDPSIRDEPDGLKRLWNRGYSFFHNNLHMIDMLNLARGVSVNRENRFEQMLEKVMQNLINPIEADLLMASRQGQIYFKDIRVLAHFFMGGVEYCSYYIQNHLDNNVDDFLAKAWVMVLHALSSGQGLEVTRGSKSDGNLIKMTELSRRSGVSPSTIRYYIQEGILSPAIKTSKTQAHYTEIHLELLALIRKKQDGESSSSSVINEEIQREALLPESSANSLKTHSGKREEILSASTELFLKKGYADMSISELAHHAHMSKETIYQNFRSKEEIFMACADRIFHGLYDTVWAEIKGEKDMAQRISIRGKAFFSSFSRWIDMMNLVRSLSVGDNPSFKEKFKQLLLQMVNPMIHELEHLKQEGLVRREIDSTLVAYMLLGLAEYGTKLFLHEGRTSEEMLSYIAMLLEKGIGHA
ncbi:MAG: TetR family transcriptional regulator [Desulfomonilia bacterium]